MTIQTDLADCKPAPTDEQQTFLDALSTARAAPPPDILMLRLSGGPGTGKSFTIAQAAQQAADDDWVVLMIGPTHQATGVLASAVPEAFPFEPDPKATLSAGEIMYCTAHRLCAWVQKSRASQAVQGATDPVARDSWLGRSFRKSWDAPPTGCLVIADEISMYPGQMTQALRATLSTLQREFKDVIFVAVGDPNQLTPVRGPSYVYIPAETSDSPSPLVTASQFTDHRLTVNVRAKHPELRHVVETFLMHGTVPPPADPSDTGAPYGWTEADARFFETWAEMVRTVGESRAVILGYRRASVAAANDALSRILHGAPSGVLGEGRKMRVQETYSPRKRTLAASSDLVQVESVEQVDDEKDALALILPPLDGYAAVYDTRVQAILTQVVTDDLIANGPLPAVTVTVAGDRAGRLSRVPVAVASEHDQMTVTAMRWAKLESALTQAAFRRNHPDTTVRRGLAAVYFHLADSAKLKLEAPYAMTSHRAQGSTYAHVAVLADGCRGGRVVDHRIESQRRSSGYVMLSRASESLTVAWAPRLAPLISDAEFRF